MSNHHSNEEEEGEDGQQQQRIAAWRVALKAFTSQWFLVPQGTGILSICLHQLHYQFHGLGRISQVFWVLTILLLLLFLLIYLLRITIYPRHVAREFATNVQETACLASVSIAFTTIYQMIALNLVTDWSPSWGMVAYVMFWVNAALAAVACIGIPYVFTKLQGPGIDNIAPSTLLPLIAALTAAAGGGVVCRYGQLGANLQVPVIIVSYLFVGLGLPLSVVIDAVFLARLFDKSFPVKQKVYQLMILCGPLGQGSFALQILGNVVQRGAFASYDNSPFVGPGGASTVATSSEFMGLLTWGYGIFWWGFACVAVGHYLVTEPKELVQWHTSLASWAMVFPWGVYTNGAIQLGVTLNSRAFWVWSTILTILLVVLWLLNAVASIIGVSSGKLLELDRGWKATYYTHAAEEAKERGDEDEDSERNGDGEEQGQDGQQNGQQNGKYGDGQSNGLRQRER